MARRRRSATATDLSPLEVVKARGAMRRQDHSLLWWMADDGGFESVDEFTAAVDVAYQRGRAKNLRAALDGPGWAAERVAAVNGFEDEAALYAWLAEHEEH